MTWVHRAAANNQLIPREHLLPLPLSSHSNTHLSVRVFYCRVVFFHKDSLYKLNCLWHEQRQTKITGSDQTLTRQTTPTDIVKKTFTKHGKQQNASSQDGGGGWWRGKVYSPEQTCPHLQSLTPLACIHAWRDGFTRRPNRLQWTNKWKQNKKKDEEIKLATCEKKVRHKFNNYLL